MGYLVRIQKRADGLFLLSQIHLVVLDSNTPTKKKNPEFLVYPYSCMYLSPIQSRQSLAQYSEPNSRTFVHFPRCPANSRPGKLRREQPTRR